MVSLCVDCFVQLSVCHWRSFHGEFLSVTTYPLFAFAFLCQFRFDSIWFEQYPFPVYLIRFLRIRKGGEETNNCIFMCIRGYLKRGKKIHSGFESMLSIKAGRVGWSRYFLRKSSLGDSTVITVKFLFILCLRYFYIFFFSFLSPPFLYKRNRYTVWGIKKRYADLDSFSHLYHFI